MADNKQSPVKPLGDIFAPIAEPIYSRQHSFARRHLRGELIGILIILLMLGVTGWMYTTKSSLFSWRQQNKVKSVAVPSSQNSGTATSQSQVGPVNYRSASYSELTNEADKEHAEKQ